MIIEHIPVQKLVARDIPNLDPLHLFLEDLGDGKGQLTVRCYDRSWTAYWGAMGTNTKTGKPSTLSEFVRSCDEHYLANSLERGIAADQFSGDALVELARKTILGRRRASLRPDRFDDETWDKDQAREAYDRLSDLQVEDLTQCPGDLMFEIFGDEWWHRAGEASEPNPSYLYLLKVVSATQDALKQLSAAPVG